MFVAMKKMQDSVIWHLLKIDDADMNPYEAALEMETDDKLDMSCITTCRHFLGWTEDITVNFCKLECTNCRQIDADDSQQQRARTTTYNLHK